jgi:hypothetical protein
MTIGSIEGEIRNKQSKVITKKIGCNKYRIIHHATNVESTGRDAQQAMVAGP